MALMVLLLFLETLLLLAVAAAALKAVEALEITVVLVGVARIKAQEVQGLRAKEIMVVFLLMLGRVITKAAVVGAQARLEGMDMVPT